MRLDFLELRNYRNYSRLELEPGPQLNVFLGRNGQGKTNLLEAVALLALSSSPRARRESELIGALAEETRVEARVEASHRTWAIALNIAAGEGRARRTIKVNGAPRRAVDLPGTFRVSLFWPDDLNLVKAGPEHRRRFLNQLLVQVEAGYARSLARYTRTLEQRNHLLKQIAAQQESSESLAVWDEQLALHGAEITRAREEAVAGLAGLAREKHAEMAANEQLDLRYVGSPPDLLPALRETLLEDLRRGVTGVGPHRDDVSIQLNGQDARSFASQGQQRTAVVSMKLAEARLVEERTGEPPVLLLDDVLSELDLERRAALLEQVSGRSQVIITSVDAAPFPAQLMGKARVRCINAGRIQPCG